MDEYNITLNDLDGDQRDLAETIGIEAYLKLVRDRGGTTVYVAKQDKLLALKRNAGIIRDFNGYNHKFLALKYNVSDRTVREVLEADRAAKSGRQLSLFDEKFNNKDGENI